MPRVVSSVRRRHHRGLKYNFIHALRIVQKKDHDGESIDLTVEDTETESGMNY